MYLQVMSVEHLLRKAGVSSPLKYKPDIFSALGIYTNNRWGLPLAVSAFLEKTTGMGILPFINKMVLCFNYFANLLCYNLKYLLFCMIGMIFYMIWVSDECQHGDAIPVSQQFGECDLSPPASLTDPV